MSPVSVATSRSTHALETGEAKLWSLLVGVNQYWDRNLPSLRYPAFDCQGLGEALAEATQGFPRKELIVHHDFAAASPTLETVQVSLKQIVAAAKPEDTILLYFSGHGVLDPQSQQVVLCLADTSKDDLHSTGLCLPDLLQLLSNSSVHRQMLWLDACHSGDMTLRGAKGETAAELPVLNPTHQLVEVLRQRATQSKGFYALLSCDQKQRSWEFPELEHGLFTYYLMRGLRGEAADAQGVIDADGLYKYVYHQTLQYIEQTNQQLRVINQQKRSRGEMNLHPEYPLQTPKRIVEGVGELVLGLKTNSISPIQQRRAIIIDGTSNHQTTLALGKVWREAGGFELDYWPQPGKTWAEVRNAIQTCLRSLSHQSFARESSNQQPSTTEAPTLLLYLRGDIEEIEDGEAWLVLGDHVRLSRSWLQQELRRARMVQQIVILDCPGTSSLSNWVEELKLNSQAGQCLLAASAISEQPEQFTQALLKTLVAKKRRLGLPVAAWITKLQVQLETIHLPLHAWLSGGQSVIEFFPDGSRLCADFHSASLSPIKPSAIKVLPSSSGSVLEDVQIPEAAEADQVIEPTLALSVTIPVSPQVELASTSNSFPEQFAQLEKILKELVGPIAPMLLRQVAAQTPNPQAWVENLAWHLSPHQQAQLKQQAIPLLQATSFQSSTQLSGREAIAQPQTKSFNTPSLQPQTISESFVHQCEQALANCIGPIANFLVQKALKSYPQISTAELVEVLAAEIPEPQKATEFRQRLLF